VKVKHDGELTVARCDVDEALADAWRELTEPPDVVRVIAPPVEDWAALRARGFVCKPKYVAWAIDVHADRDSRHAALHGRQRRNLHRADREAHDGGLTWAVRRGVTAELMDEFLVLYRGGLTAMRRGLDAAGHARDEVVADAGSLAITAREPSGALVGGLICRENDQGFRFRFAAVTPRWRRASLARVVYDRAVDVARDSGWTVASGGVDPNLYGVIAEPELYGFKVRLGWRPVASQDLDPDLHVDEADLVLRLENLSDPALAVAYCDAPSGHLQLHVITEDDDLDLRRYTGGPAGDLVVQRPGVPAQQQASTPYS
jgi:hypothetical protein